MGRTEHHHWNRRVAGFFFGDRNAHRGVGVDQMSGLPQYRANRRRGLVLVRSVGGKHGAQRRERLRRERKPARLSKRGHERAYRPAVAAMEVE